MMWHFHATQSIELSLTVESCSEQRHCTAIVTLQHFMVWSLFSRLSADLAHSACFSQDQSASSLGRWYKTVLGPNRRMQLSQLNAWYSVNTTSRPQPPSSWTLFSPLHPPQLSSGHSNTGKLSNVPSVGQRSRFCSHLLKYFLLQTWVDARGRAMESHQTELELINKHLMGESSLLHLGR